MEADQEEILKDITSVLNSNHIPYMITGAWSVIFYGRPRASHDIDFVVELYPSDVPNLLKTLKKLKFQFSYRESDIKEAVIKRGMFQVVHDETALKLDFWLLSKDIFDEVRFDRKRKEYLLDQDMIFSSPEDTILQKLRWYKDAHIEKHLVDAAFVYQIQKKRLDMEYLKKWIQKLDVAKYFKELSTINLNEYL